MDGGVTQIAITAGLATVNVQLDLDSQTYSVEVAGQSTGPVPFDAAVSAIDAVRFLANELQMANFSARGVDNVVVWRAAPPCVIVQNLTLSNQTISGPSEFEACNSVSAGANFEVGGSGDVTLRSKHVLILQAGFSVLGGGRLSMEIDPTTGGASP